MKIVLITIVMLLVAMLLLGIRVFFVKGGRFPNSHIDGNSELKKRGIICVRRDNEFK